MDSKRKEARERCKSLKTAQELDELLQSLNITDEERAIADLVLHHGWSYTQVSMKYGYAVRQVANKMTRVYNQLCT